MSDGVSAGSWGRLPQDVWAEVGAVPQVDLSDFTGTVDAYARAHNQALVQGEHGARARSCWGLIARGADALPWVRAQLSSGDDDRMADAAGVLGWIGPSHSDVPALRAVLEAMPDSEAHDVVSMVLDSVMGPEPGEEMPPPSALLLDGSMERFAETIWFVEAPFDDVAHEATQWLTGLGGRTFTPLTEALPVMLAGLEPWAMPSWKQIIVQTDSDWTAIFNQSGSGIYTHEVVGRRVGARRLETGYSPHVVRNRQIANYGSCKFG